MMAMERMPRIKKGMSPAQKAAKKKAKQAGKKFKPTPKMGKGKAVRSM